MHPAHQTIGISAGTSAWQACHEIGRPAAEPPRPRRVCLLWPATPPDRRCWRRSSPSNCGKAGGRRRGAVALRPVPTARSPRPGLLRLPGPAGRANRTWEDWQVRCVRRYWRQRRRDSGTWTAAGLAFPGWPELAREVTGGDFRPARPPSPARITPAAAAGQSPDPGGRGVVSLPRRTGRRLRPESCRRRHRVADRPRRWPQGAGGLDSSGSRPGLCDDLGAGDECVSGRLPASAGQCRRLGLRSGVTMPLTLDRIPGKRYGCWQTGTELA